MADWDSASPAHAAEDAWAAVDRETRKLAELGRHWDEASTTVRAKDHSLEMTFDGRGELVDLVFNTSKYRAMPPAKLAAVIVETLAEGRRQAQQKMSDLMGLDEVPGLDLNGLVTGQVRPDELVNALMGPMLRTLEDFGVDMPAPNQRTENGRRGEHGNG